MTHPLDFKTWFDENATTSGDVAVFARPVIGGPLPRGDPDREKWISGRLKRLLKRRGETEEELLTAIRKGS